MLRLFCVCWMDFGVSLLTWQCVIGRYGVELISHVEVSIGPSFGPIFRLSWSKFMENKN